jgi:cyclopropane fatty-acyl-phospholipid synthase-like methyltransferase
MAEWNQILGNEIYSPEEPDDFVTHFLSKLNKKQKTRILDLGCGRGRHVAYAVTHGFEAHGIDASGTGLRATKKKIQDADAYLVKCDMRMFPYKRSCFDIVISLRTVYHQTFDGIQRTVSEIKRILNKDGTVLIDFLSKRTYSYGKGGFR